MTAPFGQRPMKLFAKSPMQQRREAERSGKPSPQPLPSASVDALKLPQLEAETTREVRPATDWLAHIEAGRIEVK